MVEQIKRFNELTLNELYEILKLRSAVFVVEQECVYQDVDGKDQEAIHVWLEDEDGIVAYLRVMDKGVEGEYVYIGRVVTTKRRCGLGSRLLEIGIRVARQEFGADVIVLEAQTYAQGLYAKQGFEQISEEYLLDGIPHIKMLRKPK